MSDAVKVASLKDFLSDSSASQQAFVDTVGGALQDIGFFALDEHNVDLGLIDKAYGLARQFFEMSKEDKNKYVGNLQRGLIPYGKESAKGVDAPDLKEFWQVGRELTQLSSDSRYDPIWGDNVWPTEIPEFKETFLTLYKQLEECSQHVLQACALYIGEQRNLFADMAQDGDTIFRLIHYPPVPENANPDSIRAAAHEDINLITILCESTDDGLELLKRDGSWLPVKAQHGQLVIDTGDMIQNVTNGLYKSTTHRVTNPNNDRSRRFSMPFFVHARPEVNVSPMASCIEKTGGKAKFPEHTQKSYLQERLKELGLM